MIAMVRPDTKKEQKLRRKQGPEDGSRKEKKRQTEETARECDKRRYERNWTVKEDVMDRTRCK